MRYLVLATDYDGTIAHQGQLDEPTILALEMLRANGRRIFLVTGRELEDLKRVCPRLDLFDVVVAENGALLYTPADKRIQVLGEAPTEAFVVALRARGAPVSVGHSIVATWTPHETSALEAIRELGLELQVIFNKGAVMVLPAGINKASGLQAALRQHQLSPHNVVGIGDAENDHAFLSACECGAAVANALPPLKERADWVARGDHGIGVCELVDALLYDDLALLDAKLQHHWILLGTGKDGIEQRLSPYATNLLISGSSASGKSTLATALLDQLVNQGYQCCIIDPEGDYHAYTRAKVLGDAKHEPTIEAILAVLADPSQHVVVNLLGVKLEQRPAYLDRLLPRLEGLRSQTGRPHWILVDEAHHMLHADRLASGISQPKQRYGMLYITVHPDQMAAGVLETIDQVAIVGEAPDLTLGAFCRAVGQDPLPGVPSRLDPGELLFWRRGTDQPPLRLRSAMPTSEHLRHKRKYVEGDLNDASFFFRGPEGKLNLRAHNLMIFLQIADGVDDGTWLFHLREGHIARWLHEAVQDDELAAQVTRLAADQSLDPRASRARLRVAIEERYTAPA